MIQWRKDSSKGAADFISIKIPVSLQVLLPKELKTDHLVRIGNRRDGGYLIPSLVASDAKTLISFGLGADFSFEKEIAMLNPSIPITVYDHSVSLLISFMNLVSGITRGPKLRSRSEVRIRLSSIYHPAVFILKYIIFFKIRANTKHIQKKVVKTVAKGREATIASIMSNCQSGALVKIDIEGSEYEILPTVFESAAKIVCLVVEIHDICAREAEFRRLLDRTLEHFALAHIHVNNASKVIDEIPDILELTFVAKQRVLSEQIDYDLPIIGLDFPNLIHEKDYKLDFSARN